MLIENDKIITNEKELVENFNNHYINIVENSCGKTPSNIALEKNISNKNEILDKILSRYSNHPSVIKIK